MRLHVGISGKCRIMLQSPASLLKTLRRSIAALLVTRPVEVSATMPTYRFCTETADLVTHTHHGRKHSAVQNCPPIFMSTSFLALAINMLSSSPVKVGKFHRQRLRQRILCAWRDTQSQVATKGLCCSPAKQPKATPKPTGMEPAGHTLTPLQVPWVNILPTILTFPLAKHH